MRRWVVAISLGLAAAGAAGEDLFKAGMYNSMFSDKKAYRPGEVLTVLIEENASLSASADTTTDKTGALNIGAKSSWFDKSVSINAAEDFAGQGRIRRSGKVLAQLSVIVQSVDPQGLLLVHGRQIIEMNGERQEIELSGKVRPTDIQESNTISSTRVADAHIRFVGAGILAEKQRAGLLTRLLSFFRLL